MTRTEAKSDKSVDLFAIRSILFLPASNPRAIAKARTLDADLVILDLEDSVRAEDKDAARAAAVEAAAEPWPMPVAIRINAPLRQDSLERMPHPEFSRDDAAAVAGSKADFVVLPKAESGIGEVADITGKPVLAMVETPLSVMMLAGMLGNRGLAGLIVGTNDLAAGLGLPGPEFRPFLAMALQTVICGARSAGLPVWDGVFNALEDPAGFERECREGRLLGFDGKTLIHPSQVDPCNRIFSPSVAEVDRAERLIAAATGGAERFEGAMIEGMHVDAARRILRRAGR